jgi:pimeloyl-ACP methyl ester carboxylesterase
MDTLRIPPGLNIGYEEHGDGPTLVQVHGLGGGSRPGAGVWNFKYTTPFLSKKFKVVNIDMPGYGTSDPSPNGGGLLELSDHVANFIREYAGEPVYLHGSSFGGSTVIAVAGRHPDVVSRLVVSVALPRHDKAALARRKLWMALMDLNIDFEHPEIHALVYAQSGYAREFYERPDADEILDEYMNLIKHERPKKDGLKSLLSNDLMEFTDAIKAPTLCIGGAEDNQTPVITGASGAGMKDFSEAVADGELAVIPGCGHYLHFEKPEETAAAITDFLTRRAAG